jgi:hypothetical protein
MSQEIAAHRPIQVSDLKSQSVLGPPVSDRLRQRLARVVSYVCDQEAAWTAGRPLVSSLTPEFYSLRRHSVPQEIFVLDVDTSTQLDASKIVFPNTDPLEIRLDSIASWSFAAADAFSLRS